WAPPSTAARAWSATRATLLRGCWAVAETPATAQQPDRKSTRLNSSHGSSSYAVFCLKKKPRSTPPEHLIAAFDPYYFHPAHIETLCRMCQGRQSTHNLLHGVTRSATAVLVHTVIETL